MLVAGALLDGVALRALGAEDLVAAAGVTGGGLAEGSHVMDLMMNFVEPTNN